MTNDLFNININDNCSSSLVVVGVFPLAVLVLYLVTMLARAVRDTKTRHRPRDESGEAGLSQVVTSSGYQQIYHVPIDDSLTTDSDTK